MKFSGRTTVAKFKSMFRDEFKVAVHVYNGKRFAEDSATLASIRNGGDTKKCDLELHGNMKVGNAEKLFKDAFGISIQIEDRTGRLADNNMTIASLKSVNDVNTADKAITNKTSGLQEINEGDYLKFGSYYQENASEKTPIEWLVLKKSGSKALLISRYGLDCKQYHSELVDMTWENCDLRKWLNGEFLKNAFTVSEQKKISLTKVANNNNPDYSTIGGNSTEDRVFCLSLAEAENFFNDDEARKCVPTPHAVKEGAYEDSDNLIEGRGCCCWWLRSPGEEYQEYASGVDSYGELRSDGFDVDGDDYAVRPALWMNL